MIIRGDGLRLLKLCIGEKIKANDFLGLNSKDLNLVLLLIRI